MVSKINVLEIVKKKSPSSILIVTGKSSYLNSPFYDYIKTIQLEYQTTLWNYSKDYPDFKEIKNFTEKKSYDFIISYGGGTVIDVAKAISVGSLLDKFSQIFDKHKINSSVYHVCVPTTFGSGSESTSFAVLYRDNIKFSIQSQQILPNEVILDHQYTLNLTGKNSYCSVMDSFCQSIESLWSIHNTKESSKYALKSISLISKCLKNINNLSYNNRKNLLMASNLSGRAINITRTTAPHAFSYYLTINHGICHGEAVSVLFDRFIDLNFSSISDPNKKKLMEILKVSNKKELIVFFIKLKIKLGFVLSLNEIKNLNVNLYSKSINIERLKNNPIKINPLKFIKESLN
jgi:alcohol dehydrogenase